MMSVDNEFAIAVLAELVDFRFFCALAQTLATIDACVLVDKVLRRTAIALILNLVRPAHNRDRFFGDFFA